MADTVSTPPLATPAEFSTRFPSLVLEGAASDPAVLSDMMDEATGALEDMTTRRLTTFTNLQETHTLFGIDPDEYGSAQPGMPLPWAGSLGSSFANALGVTDLVRKMWLNEYAPRYPELWTYDTVSITLRLSVGGLYAANLTTLEGPYPDTGMVRFPLGVFAPEGTTAVIIYSGGYTTPPPSLRRACLYQTALNLITEIEPQMAKDVSVANLEQQLEKAIAPWMRG